MLRRAIVFTAISIALAFCQNAAHASVSPDAFLSEVLSKDFEGDGVFRLGRIIFTKPQRQVPTDCDCQGPDEVFDPKKDRIVIASDWAVVETKMESVDLAAVKVRFRVVALTKGEGDFSNKDKQRRILPLAMPRNEFVVYHLRQAVDRWALVDPPLPRVG